MTNFRHEESMAPAGDEAIGAIANDVAWTRVEHPAMLRAGKRAVDIAAALFFFCAFGWLYVLIALGVFITSGAPVLYSQPRFGRGGRVFKFYKFRSMLRNSAEILEEHLRNDPVARQQWDDYQKLENDPRITRFGKFIRKTSLDELPQFWNVLVGDMSVVGPRPPLPSEVTAYDGTVFRRLYIKPGITGLWQVSGRSDLSWDESVRLDLRYVENWSVMNDLQIMWRTAKVMVQPSGAY